jgi:2-phospho-L-lactate guanylyltransferase (CobY/MobA/RfbA family)
LISQVNRVMDEGATAAKEAAVVMCDLAYKAMAEAQEAEEAAKAVEGALNG